MLTLDTMYSPVYHTSIGMHAHPLQTDAAITLLFVGVIDVFNATFLNMLRLDPQ